MPWNSVGSTPKTVYNQLQNISVADSNVGDIGEDDTVYIPAEMDAHSHVFEGDTTLSSNTTLGSSTLTEIVASRFEGNLTIDSGATLTVQDRSRGLFILIKGDLTVSDGSISMSKSGHGFSANDIGYPLVVLPDVVQRGDKALLPLHGAKFASAIHSETSTASGTQQSGFAGSNGACGSGGAGGSRAAEGGAGAVGGVGTIFSGGSGSGGMNTEGTSSLPNPNNMPQDYGLAGGDGLNVQTGNNLRECGGGAGNPGGSGAGGANDGEDGCGGSILIICEGQVSIETNGIIESKGGDGGDAGYVGGSGSGGGAINIYHQNGFTNNGTMIVDGGIGGTGGQIDGADGGAGSTETTQVTL